jgi:hypothetical protein
VKAWEGPALPECGGGVLDGGDTGEVFFGNGRWSSTARVLGVEGLLVRLVGDVASILLGF